MSNPPKIKGLLFDFNGTLFFDSKLHIEAFKRYFVEHGKEEPTEEYITQQIFGKNNSLIYAENFNPTASEEEWQAFAEAKEGLYRSFCLERPDLMKYTDGVPEMLDYLKEKSIPFCLATGSGMDNISFYMEHMGLGRWFDLDNIVCFDGSFQGKPEPDTYLLAAKKIGLDASECIIFEDGTSGLLAAKRANAGAIVCVYDHELSSPFTQDVSCDIELNDFTDWRRVLTQFGIM